jgi:hypothetical protein
MGLLENAKKYRKENQNKTQAQILKDANAKKPVAPPANQSLPSGGQSKVPTFVDTITQPAMAAPSKNQSSVETFVEMANKNTTSTSASTQNQSKVTPFTELAQSSSSPAPASAPASGGAPNISNTQNQSQVPQFTDLATNNNTSPSPSNNPDVKQAEQYAAPYGRWPSGVPIRADETGGAAPFTPSDMLDLTPGGSVNMLMGVGFKTIGKEAYKKTLQEMAEYNAKSFAELQIKKEAARLIIPLEKKGAAILAGEVGEKVNNAAAGAISKTAVGEIAINTATTATKLIWLKNFVKTMKYPAMVAGVAAGWLMSGTFAYNELNDAIFSVNFKVSEAIKAGDVEYAQELTDRMEELNKFNNAGFILGGPVSYITAAMLKGESSVKDSQIAIDKEKQKQELENDFLDRYGKSQATPDEIAAYAKSHPYSMVAESYKAEQKNLDAQGNSIFGTIDENGNYIPSAT